MDNERIEFVQFYWPIQVLLREIFKDNELNSNNERLIIFFTTNLKQLSLHDDFIIRVKHEYLFSYSFKNSEFSLIFVNIVYRQQIFSKKKKKHEFHVGKNPNVLRAMDYNNHTKMEQR